MAQKRHFRLCPDKVEKQGEVELAPGFNENKYFHVAPPFPPYRMALPIEGQKSIEKTLHERRDPLYITTLAGFPDDEPSKKV